MKDFFFLCDEKTKMKYDEFLKQKCGQIQIFMLTLISFYLIFDSLCTFLLIFSDLEFQKDNILVGHILKIILHFVLFLISFYFTKIFLKYKKILYLDVFLSITKIMHLIIIIETELILLEKISENKIVIMIFEGTKLVLLELTYQISYSKWFTKVLSFIIAFSYTLIRLNNSVILIMPNILLIILVIIIILIKLEQISRNEFLQKSFPGQNTYFKSYLEILQQEIVEDLFNSLDNGIIILDKNLNILKMNNISQVYFPQNQQITQENQFLSSKIIKYKEIPNIYLNILKEKTLKLQNSLSPTKISKFNSNLLNETTEYLMNNPDLIDFLSELKKKLFKINLKSETKDIKLTLEILLKSETNQKKFQYFELTLIPLINDNSITRFIIILKDISLISNINTLILESSNKSKALSFVSHEMRTPLNCIIGMLNMMQEFLKPVDCEQYLYPAVTSAKFLLNLLNDLLDIAQIQAGKFKLVKIEFNLRSLLEEIMSMISVQAKAKGLTLLFDFDMKIPKLIQSDPNRIRQIVTNLLGNALKFTQKGFITLKAIIDIIDNSLIHILVIDNGIGIKDENKDKLFKAFGKLETDENEYLNSQGVGLGLLISNILAKNIGPDQSKLNLIKNNNLLGLNVESEYGKGATFRFIIEDKNESDLMLFTSNRHCNLNPHNLDAKFIIDKNGGNSIIKEKLSKFHEESSNTFKTNLSLTQSNITNNDKNRRNTALTPLLNRNNLRNTVNFTHLTDFSTDNPPNKELFLKLLMNSSSLHQEAESPDDKQNTEKFKFHQKSKDFCNNGCSKILICDDDFYNLFILLNYLKDTTLKVDKAYNGVEALEKVETLYESSKCCKAYKIILMDIEMPQKNGYEATKDILEFYKNKGAGQHFNLPVIIATTGHTTEEEILKIKECGMNETINKPINKKDLLLLIEKILNKN